VAECIWLGAEPSGGILRHGNEHLDSIQEWEFIDQLNRYELPKKDSAPRSYFKSNLRFEGLRAITSVG
jgi:hypothetical protein